jgi:hypothetical protein
VQGRLPCVGGVHVVRPLFSIGSSTRAGSASERPSTTLTETSITASTVEPVHPDKPQTR